MTFSLIPAKGKKQKTRSATSFSPFFCFMWRKRKTEVDCGLPCKHIYIYMYERKTKDIFRFPFFVLCARIDSRSLVFPFIMDTWGVALSANQCTSARGDKMQCNNVHEGLKNHYKIRERSMCLTRS